MEYKLNEKITDVLKKHEFRVSSIDEQDNSVIAELEAYSPAGEDLIVDIWYDGTTADFVDSFERYANDFDSDEHAEQLVDCRGTHGVPNSIRDIIDDADAIAAMLQDLAADLSALDFDDEDELFTDEKYIRQNWREVIESPMPYYAISNAIEWGFSTEDLQELMRLHKENICRKKIEDLLEDCNFHYVCGEWHDGNYVLYEG